MSFFFHSSFLTVKSCFACNDKEHNLTRGKEKKASWSLVNDLQLFAVCQIDNWFLRECDATQREDILGTMAQFGL